MFKIYASLFETKTINFVSQAGPQGLYEMK